MVKSICNRGYVTVGPKSSCLDINPINSKSVGFVVVIQIAISWSLLSQVENMKISTLSSSLHFFQTEERKRWQYLTSNVLPTF